MKLWKKPFVYILCGVLTLAAFFAKDFVLYDFHMDLWDYRVTDTQENRPQQAETSVWFAYGDGGRELQFGHSEDTSLESVRLYALTANQAVPVAEKDLTPIRRDFLGNFIAAAPEVYEDIDQDGTSDRVWDFARADFGKDAFNPVPQRFGSPEIPFELVFAERKYIMAYFEGQLLTNAEITVLSSDGTRTAYETDEHGWIDGLPIRDIRSGFTAIYSPDDSTGSQDSSASSPNVNTYYRMYYALEDYPYFSPHFWRAHQPIFLMLLLSAAGIVLVQLVRVLLARSRAPLDGFTHRDKIHFTSPLSDQTGSRFLMIRWGCLLTGMFLWTYFGKLIDQGQLLNEIAVPVFACPFNLDQVVEAPCYYLSHLPGLFTRFGPDFPGRNLFYGLVYLGSLLLFLLLLGKILCGFLCPAGLIQDWLDKLRQSLHIRPIVVDDKLNRLLQPVKWTWIILFLGFAFTGNDFCDICPLKGFATAQGGYWTNLYLGGFLAVIILVGSFFIKRFWCLICPMGYIMGLLRRFNLFKLKKDCTACTECGACYEACPMRIKSIYTEREQANIQTVDCIMCGECIRQCPEDHALSMTLCNKDIYHSSRITFLSKYEPKKDKKRPKQTHDTETRKED